MTRIQVIQRRDSICGVSSKPTRYTTIHWEKSGENFVFSRNFPIFFLKMGEYSPILRKKWENFEENSKFHISFSWFSPVCTFYLAIHYITGSAKQHRFYNAVQYTWYIYKYTQNYNIYSTGRIQTAESLV